MKIGITGKTDIGKERDQNEDAILFCPDLAHPVWNKPEASIEQGALGTLLVVADGMGGANAGEIASNIATENIKRYFSVQNVSSAINNEEQVLEFLQSSIKDADDAIKRHTRIQPETIGMGTTIVICWLLGNKAYIAWCGDSRCYVYNKITGLRALTKDHSYVQELVDRGDITEEAAFSHPDSNIITKGLGDFDIDILPDTVIYPIHNNDIFLLCSDGLCGYCTNRTIETVIETRYTNLNECCDSLMKLALDAGGYDNISIVIASVSDETLPQPISHGSGIHNLFKSLFSKK